MAWCHQATSHYLKQCWPRSLPPYGVTRPQWVNRVAIISQMTFPDAFSWKKMLICWFKFHWSLLLRDQLIISQLKSSLVQVMAGHWTGDKPIPEPMSTMNEVTACFQLRGMCVLRPISFIYIIISKNIRYLLWNRGAWRFFHDTYLTIEVQGIRCTNHLHDSCPFTDVTPHFTAPGCRFYFKINSRWPIVTS